MRILIWQFNSGPGVINRKAARLCGRNVAERKAIVIDRFFDTKQKALAWARAHSHFMMVRILTPGTEPGYSISRSHAVICVYDEADNVIETHEHTSPLSPADISLVATHVVDAMVIDDHDTSFGRTNRLRVC
jgi:hypothetical protein